MDYNIILIQPIHNTLKMWSKYCLKYNTFLVDSTPNMEIKSIKQSNCRLYLHQCQPNVKLQLMLNKNENSNQLIYNR